MDQIRLDIDAKNFDEKKKLAIKRFNKEFPKDIKDSTILFDITTSISFWAANFILYLVLGFILAKISDSKGVTGLL